ncbi:glycogen debranching N-terminal domain-containing protein [Mariniluteicoccus endophyticus]
MARQQPLHQLVTSVAAPTLVLSDASGDIGTEDLWPDGGEGVFHADQRVLAVCRMFVDGVVPISLARKAVAGDQVFSSLGIAHGDDPMKDPALRIDRRRAVEPGTVREELLLTSMADRDETFLITLKIGCDDGSMAEVRNGDDRSLVPHGAQVTPEGVTWTRGEATYSIAAPGAVVDLLDPTLISLTWEGTIAAHCDLALSWELRCQDEGGAVVAARGTGLDVDAITQRLVARLEEPVREGAATWLLQSLRDLNGLRMATTARPEDAFFAAGSPWYLTLFGRDSLWTARLLVDVDVSHAGSTLRALAALQGDKDDQSAAEQPGKIMHELRRGELDLGAIRLPPLYFGTIDATALWVCLLVDAWRAGLPADDIRALLPNLRPALEWITTSADADGDGFAEYIDVTGHGLANQGWKDSADSVRFHDGSRAEGPVALCEVQGYAYEAATGAADMLDALGEPGAAPLREWAAALAERFRDQFWVGEGDERFVALALDGHKRPVDSVTSNMGHLLGTGLLSPDEEKVIARRLVRPDMAGELGLRTMSTLDGGYSPLSYHCGSVWPHDTAVVIRGMLRAGLHDEARVLAQGLYKASFAWDDRMPELWSGEDTAVPYPAACRPQAWSAAAAVVAVQAL